MKNIGVVTGMLLVGLMSNAQALQPGSSAKDLLNRPSIQSKLAKQSLINGLARMGSRVVAVGQRGHILWSADSGKNWTQAQAPVSVDLTAVSFSGVESVVAVGHDSVVLHSKDAGQTWVKVMDGRDLDANAAQNPLLDLFFESESTGYAVGAFGTALKTLDGGRSWSNVSEQFDNPNTLHLYGIRKIGETLFVVGEQGLVLKHNPLSQRFDRISVPYQGTLFGVSGDANAVWVYGLRGTVLRSVDSGQSWQQLETGVQTSITASTMGPLGQISLVSLSGQVLRADSSTAKPVLLEKRLAQPASAVVQSGNDELLVGGLRGLQTYDLSSSRGNTK